MKKLYEKCGPENSSYPFQRILCKKESEELCMKILTNFDSFAMTYLI